MYLQSISLGILKPRRAPQIAGYSAGIAWIASQNGQVLCFGRVIGDISAVALSLVVGVVTT